MEHHSNQNIFPHLVFFLTMAESAALTCIPSRCLYGLKSGDREGHSIYDSCNVRIHQTTLDPPSCPRGSFVVMEDVFHHSIKVITQDDFVLICSDPISL